ncbi:MAG: SHOCT domain-containing protein, partial [Anaerolineae bacterium]
PTDETNAAIDEAASMGAIGDMDRYMKFKTARAVGDAATAEGGAAAGTAQMGLGLGAGMAAAQAMASSFAAGSQQQAAPGTSGQAEAADPVAALTTLKTLLDGGLISQEEYDAKRKDILSRL